MIDKNGGTTPKNILVDGTALGTATGGSGTDNLRIDIGSISRRKDKGRSGGFGICSRGVWVRDLTRSGIGCRDVTMLDHHPMEGNRLFSQRIKRLTQIPG